LQFDSAGTADYHIGHPPDARSLKAALARGYDLSALRARQLQAADFHRFDLLLAMDEDNLAQMRRLAPSGMADRAQMFLSFAPNTDHRSVPDPYYGEATGFDTVLDLAERGVRGLFVALAARKGAGRG
jgi:protein-tyrosine phosphatase